MTCVVENSNARPRKPCKAVQNNPFGEVLLERPQEEEEKTAGWQITAASHVKAKRAENKLFSCNHRLAQFSVPGRTYVLAVC